MRKRGITLDITQQMIEEDFDPFTLAVNRYLWHPYYSSVGERTLEIRRKVDHQVIWSCWLPTSITNWLLSNQARPTKLAIYLPEQYLDVPKTS